MRFLDIEENDLPKAVDSAPFIVIDMPKKYLTEDIMMIAIRKAPILYIWAPNKTKKLYDAMVAACPHLQKYFKRP